MFRILALLVSHGFVFVIGFGLGVYLLPILIAEESPQTAQLQQAAQTAMFEGSFTRDLRGSDFLHWGEGTISLTDTQIVHNGKLSPGPDYRLYLTKSFVENEDEFEAIKDQAFQVSMIKSFDGFIVNKPTDINLADYNSVVIWCERFGEFISAAKYR